MRTLFAIIWCAVSMKYFNDVPEMDGSGYRLGVAIFNALFSTLVNWFLVALCFLQDVSELKKNEN